MENDNPASAESGSGSPSETGDTTVLDSPSSKLPAEVKSEIAVKAFRSQRGLLLNLVRHCLPSLANSLLARDIIPKDVFEDVCNQTVNKSQRCADLLECVEDTLKVLPSKFTEIVYVLESEPFLKSMASELVQNYSNNSSASVDSNQVSVSSAISHYRAYLKAVYSSSSVSQDSKWPPTPSREYITLAVVEGQHKVKEDCIGNILQGSISQMLKKRKEISMKKILEADRLIMIEGAPGIGKSTLAWELCRKWEEFPSMQQYSLVVLLRLREAEVQKIRSVGDLFCSYESKDKKCLEDEVLERQGKGVLFILDGFDELPSDLQSKGYLRDLIRGSVLPKSTVLVTSRPSATAMLLTSCQPDKHIEILGFTQESVEAYASSIFKSQPDQLERFKTFISASNNPAINSLMYVPLNAAIIVQIFCDTKSDSFLPHTLTELYTQLCMTILNRHLKANCPSVRVDTFKDLPAQIHDQFLGLSKLAFEGLEKDEVIFHSLPPDIVHFGFLDAVSALYGGGGVSCNFLHLTLQEFLAAYYISCLNVREIKSFMKVNCSNQRRWSVTVMFLAGLTTYLDGTEVYGVSRFFLKCLFEAQGQKKRIPPYHLKHPVTFIANITTPLDWYVMGYCIANSLTGSPLKVVVKSPVDLQLFVSGLKTHVPCVANFQELHIVRLDSMFYLHDLLPNHLSTVSSLHFDNCIFKCEDLVHLSHVIKHTVCLTELSLCHSESEFHTFIKHVTVPDYTEGYSKILQSLSQSNVTTLKVLNTGVYKFATRSLTSALEQLIHPSHGKLRTLYIGDVGDHQNCKTHLCNTLKVLSANSSLKFLHLSNPCQSSLHLLASNACLTELHVHCQRPSHFFVQGVALLLMSNKHLKHVFLCTFHEAEHVKIVSELFHKNNTTMHTLKLGLIKQDQTPQINRDDINNIVMNNIILNNPIDPRVTYMKYDHNDLTKLRDPLNAQYFSRIHTGGRHPFFTIIIAWLLFIFCCFIIAILRGWLRTILRGELLYLLLTYFVLVFFLLRLQTTFGWRLWYIFLWSTYNYCVLIFFLLRFLTVLRWRYITLWSTYCALVFLQLQGTLRWKLLYTLWLTYCVLVFLLLWLQPILRGGLLYNFTLWLTYCVLIFLLLWLQTRKVLYTSWMTYCVLVFLLLWLQTMLRGKLLYMYNITLWLTFCVLVFFLLWHQIVGTLRGKLLYNIALWLTYCVLLLLSFIITHQN